MKTLQQTYTAETPASLFPKDLIVKRPVQAPINAIGNCGSQLKCITRLWDLNIPTELLQEILSRLGLKENIRASAACKIWFEAVAVKKLQLRPWLVHRQERSEDGGNYILSDPSGCQTYKLKYLEVRNHEISYSRDSWLLVLKYVPWALPSAAPTSSSCLVISFNYISFISSFATWRPGETVWTTHRFKNHPENQHVGIWNNFVFSNGLFYLLSTCKDLGVFDPSKATWNHLQVKPYPFSYHSQLFMTEHEGDIFVIFTCGIKNPSVFNFKLNLNRNVWEETRELGGLTVFASGHVSLTRAGLHSEMRNRIYTSHCRQHDMYYSLGDEKSSRPPSTTVLPYHSIWVDPPPDPFISSTIESACRQGCAE